MKLHQIILARIGRLIAPSGYRDDTSLDVGMLGLMQSQGVIPLQEVYLGWFTQDHSPLPAEVIVPVILGYNPIPLETPVYERGSYFRDDTWERP